MDDLTRRLRAANPYTDKTLTDRDREVLESIMAGTRPPLCMPTPTPVPVLRASRRRIGWAAAGAFLVTVMVLAVTMMVALISPRPSYAVTPVPLSSAPTDVTVEALLSEIRTSLTDPNDISQRTVYTEGWYLQLEPEESDRPTSIQPQVSSLEWAEDLSGRLLVTAGVPYQPEGESVVPFPEDAVEPGTVLAEESWNAGEFQQPWQDAPPPDAATMREYLESQMGMPEPFTASDYLVAAVGMLQMWTLGADQRRTLLEVLLETPGTAVGGTTVDRDGRSGLLLEFEPNASDSSHRYQLVIETGTWHILAYEAITTTAIPDYGVPPEAVTNYTLWRRTS